MKKIFFASAAILLAFVSTQAQSGDVTMVKDNVKPVKEERKEIRKEKKDQRITLRKLEGNEINYQSKQQFYRSFGDQPDVQWTKGKYFDQALFNKDGVATTAYFDFDAQLVGTTSDKTLAELPESAQKQIAKEYKDYTVEKVIFFDDNEDVDTDMIMYGSQFDDEDNYFVELKKDNKEVVLQVTMDGLVGYFTSLDK
jgi:hypothetical protein